MRNFLARLLSFAVTKGLVIFVFAVGFAQIAKFALIEAKYGNYSHIIAWAVILSPVIIYEIIKKKRNNR